MSSTWGSSAKKTLKPSNLDPVLNSAMQLHKHSTKQVGAACLGCQGLNKAAPGVPAGLVGRGHNSGVLCQVLAVLCIGVAVGQVAHQDDQLQQGARFMICDTGEGV